MELDITNMIANMEDASTYSASVMELGQDAGRITWSHAKRDAITLFGDQFDREAFDKYFSGFGAWSDGELAAHTDEECAALMLQFIAGDLREYDFEDSPEWWEDHLSIGPLGRGDDGKIYYYIGG